LSFGTRSAMIWHMKRLLVLFMLMSVPLFAQEYDDFAPDYDLDDYEEFQEYGADEVREGTNDRVRIFDISGVMLDMEMEAVREAMKERKYALKDTENYIPEFFRFNYDAQCRARGILVPDALANCIDALGKSEKMRYVSRLAFERPDTKEKIEIFFTSPLTKSRVWKIDYRNDVDDKPGPSMNFQYQREERRRAFWFSVINKYGEPNVGQNRWVLDASNEFSPNLKAFFGRLILENQQMNLADAFEAQREARRTFKFREYTF